VSELRDNNDQKGKIITSRTKHFSDDSSDKEENDHARVRRLKEAEAALREAPRNACLKENGNDLRKEPASGKRIIVIHSTVSGATATHRRYSALPMRSRTPGEFRL